MLPSARMPSTAESPQLGCAAGCFVEVHTGLWETICHGRS